MDKRLNERRPGVAILAYVWPNRKAQDSITKVLKLKPIALVFNVMKNT
jgi:hypothetical protein